MAPLKKEMSAPSRAAVLQEIEDMDGILGKFRTPSTSAQQRIIRAGDEANTGFRRRTFPYLSRQGDEQPPPGGPTRPSSRP
ncbi:hypothetical protein N0V85_006584 [Neurospora sp. IMI 360204]|nr:hypothetical protein N0V85_006584 [Neurospora sp. IMI 360204]